MLRKLLVLIAVVLCANFIVADNFQAVIPKNDNVEKNTESRFEENEDLDVDAATYSRFRPGYGRGYGRPGYGGDWGRPGYGGGYGRPGYGGGYGRPGYGGGYGRPGYGGGYGRPGYGGGYGRPGYGGVYLL